MENLVTSELSNSVISNILSVTELPPKSSTTTDALLEDFSVLVLYRHGWSQQYLHATAHGDFGISHLHAVSLHIHIHASTCQLCYRAKVTNVKDSKAFKHYWA